MLDNFSKYEGSKLEAAEMWFYRRMLKIPWTGHVTKEEVLKKIGTERKLLPTVRERQLECLGHVMKEESLDALKGRNAEEDNGWSTLTTSLSTWMALHVPEGQRRGTKEQELLKRTKERKLWKTMIITHVLKGHGTKRESSSEP